jgi:hypothetical protein
MSARTVAGDAAAIAPDFPDIPQNRLRRYSPRLTLPRDPIRSRERRLFRANTKRCDARMQGSGTRLIRFWNGTLSYAMSPKELH